MRKIIIAAIAVVVVLIGVVLVLPYFIDINKYRGEIQSQIQQKLHRPVQLGAMSLATIPPRVEVHDVTVSEDPRFKSSVPFAQVGEMDISIKLFPLLTGSIEIGSLKLKQPKIELIKDASGIWNFASLGQAPTQPPVSPAAAPPQAAPQQPAPKSSTPASGSAYSLGDLQIADGQIAITDLQQHQQRTIYDHIDLKLNGFAPNTQFSIELAAHLPGRGAETISMEGTAGPINQAQMLSTPFNGKVKLNEVSVAGAQKFLNSVALEGTDAILSGSASVVSSGGKMTAKGSLKAGDAVVHNVQVGYPITADFDVTDDLSTDLLSIRTAELRLGSTPLSVHGTFSSRTTPSIADLNVSAKDASMEDAARLAAAFGVVFSPNTKIAGNLSANVRAQGPTSNLAFSGTVNGRNLAISGKAIPQAVRVPVLDLSLTPQEIHSNLLAATSGSTTVNGQFAIAQYTSPSPVLDATIKTVNAKLDELLSIAKAYGLGAAEGWSGSGAITLDMHATGPVKNTDAMNFSGNGSVQSATLKTTSLTQPLNVRNATLQFSQNAVNISNLNASLGSTNATGNVSIANFQAPRLTFSLAADKVNITELQRLMATSKPVPVKQARSSWSLIPPAQAAPAPTPGLFDLATGSGTISVGAMVYDRTTVTNVHSGVNLNHGVIQLTPMTGQVYGGQISGGITADLHREPAAFTVNAKLNGADANQLLSAVANTKDALYGTLNANINQSFSTPAGGEVAQTLNGPFSFTLTNGKLTRIDLLNELGKIGKFGGGGKGYTSISSMTGSFDVHNGVAGTNDLKASLDVGTMAASGTINLVNEALALHLVAVLNRQYSQSVGGTSAGGYLNTVLGNKNGELVLPVIVSGTMNHPTVTPDVQKIAEMKLNNIVPGAGGIVGALLGGQNTKSQQAGKPGQSSQQQQIQSLQDALGGLLGGSKKKPPKQP